MNKQVLIKVACQLMKIACELEAFTGSEAILENKDLKESIDKSKEKIFNKYRGDK